LHENKVKANQKLKTILPNGVQEGKEKTIVTEKERGLVTYPYAQSLDEDSAREGLQTPYVWKDDEGKFNLVQVWTINYNEKFRSTFTESDTNPDPNVFEQKAVENLQKAAVDVFGDEAMNVPIKYVSTVTNNKQVVYQGTTEQILAFLDEPGIKEFLDVQSVNGNNVTVTTFQHESPVCGCSLFGPKKGTQTFTLSSDPSEKQVLYLRKGFTKFWCFKPLLQFSKECSLFGGMNA